MTEHIGWVLDIYAAPQGGVTLWLLEEDGQRRAFHQDFTFTFYAGGDNHRLRDLWRFLQTQEQPALLTKLRRRELFKGPVDVLAVQTTHFSDQRALFAEAKRELPDLAYYDVDLTPPMLYNAAFGVFLLSRCQLFADDGEIQSISVLDSPWELDPALPEFRMMRLVPDVDPAKKEPDLLQVECEGNRHNLRVKRYGSTVEDMGKLIDNYDPDLILTQWGDTWIFPHLLHIAEAQEIPFNPNRDKGMDVIHRDGLTYHTYGQVFYRGEQIHLRGRWHIDVHNAMMYADYELGGIYEQTRVTGVPLQETARRSPGYGISAMQMVTALRNNILVPNSDEQVEFLKTGRDMVDSDWGGMVFQPVKGLHESVAEIDFISMYPSIMVNYNVSPETVGAHFKKGLKVPQQAMRVDQSRYGLIPATLRPLLEKRIAIKARMADLERDSTEYQLLDKRAAALKWLLVVCYGYLRYKHARFGRVEAHDVVTAFGREAMLRAKEAAEDTGYEVLHMYVDGLWVRKEGEQLTVEMLTSLLEEINHRTNLPIALEGIYRWVAFLPSRQNKNISVANRYFGIFESGEIKMRGIKSRRHDTPRIFRELQAGILELYKAVPEDEPLSVCLPDILALARSKLSALRQGKVPVDELVYRQTLSRDLEHYTRPSPAAIAAAQLQHAGKQVSPGQRIRYYFVRGSAAVRAWDLAETPALEEINVTRYASHLVEAVHELVEPLGITEERLKHWLFSNAGYSAPPGELPEETGKLPLLKQKVQLGKGGS